MEKRAICMVSLGCPKNLVDAEVMLGHFPSERYRVTTDEAEAEIIIVNTCAFIGDAKEESVETILDVADYKEHGHCRMLVVAGCLPQRYRQELAAELPEVDLFIGTGDVPRIVELIEKKEAAPDFLHIPSDPDFLYDHATPRMHSSPTYAAYVKIAEGCSNHCSYCVIPQLRGTLRSRQLSSVVAEVEDLVNQGVKEITLIAQDITAYGSDLDVPTTLEKLLKHLVKIENLQWLRLMYAYPDGVSDELIELIAREEKICNYLDLPIQHVNDHILRAMNRRMTGAQLRSLLIRLREQVPAMTLRTSLIVGFPGESDAQFQELLDFVNEGHFELLGVFRYSPEEGTPAAQRPDQVSERTKKLRQNKLMRAQKRVSFRKNRELVGRVLPTLVEGYSEETELLLKGRCICQAPDVDGQVYITAGQADVGDIVSLRITDSSDYDLIGEIVEEGDRGL